MKELVKELMETPSCCAELKEIGQQWLEAEGTDKEAEITAKLVAELKEDVLPIDAVIEFFASPQAAEIFEEQQLKMGSSRFGVEYFASLRGILKHTLQKCAPPFVPHCTSEAKRFCTSANAALSLKP